MATKHRSLKRAPVVLNSPEAGCGGGEANNSASFQYVAFCLGLCGLPESGYMVATRPPNAKRPTPKSWPKCLFLMVPLDGIELSTFALRMRCSTN